jgi:hypothetical protein
MGRSLGESSRNGLREASLGCSSAGGTDESEVSGLCSYKFSGCRKVF